MTDSMAASSTASSSADPLPMDITDAAQPQILSLAALPIDELYHLLSLCDHHTLGRLALTSKFFHHQVDTNAIVLATVHRIGACESKARPGAISVLATIAKHISASTFVPGPGFQFCKNDRCAARVFPIGYYRIRGRVALPRGSAFRMRLCPLDGFRDTMYLMQVGVEWQGAATVWGPQCIDEVSVCTDPSAPLVGPARPGAYGPGKYNIGDVIRCCFHANGDISFGVNGKDYGVAFSGVSAEEVTPFACLYLPNSIEFLGEIEYF